MGKLRAQYSALWWMTRLMQCSRATSGTVVSWPDLSVPPDWPPTVMLSGSPPKAAMFSRTQVSALISSIRP